MLRRIRYVLQALIAIVKVYTYVEIIQVANAVSNYETTIETEFTQDNNSDQHLKECVVNSGAEMREQHQIQSVEKDEVCTTSTHSYCEGIHICCRWQLQFLITKQ